MTTLSTISQDETPFCGTHHHQDDVGGYVVVATRFGEGRLYDVEVFPQENVGSEASPYFTAYGDAIALAKRWREDCPAGEYARIDVLYGDGCRRIL